MPNPHLQAPTTQVQLLFAMAYDGARLHGSALQPDVQTAAGEVLARVTRHLRPTRIWALSITARLDAGVHAHVNLLSLRIALCAAEAHPDVLRRALDALEQDETDALDTLVVCVVPHKLSARGLARSKTYRYVVEDNNTHEDPSTLFPQRKLWRVVPKLSHARMQAAADVFVGSHDFTGFAASPKRRKQTQAQATKRIIRLSVCAQPHPHAKPEQTLWHIECEASGLLRRQMRFMAANIICAGAGLITPVDIATQLRLAQPPLPRAPQAPACGLYLMALDCAGTSLPWVVALTARLHAATTSRACANTRDTL